MSFNVGTMKPYLEGERTLEMHNFELDLIKKYSPFKNQAALKDQFKKIEGDSGTLVVCYNLKLLQNGQSEFDIESDEHDIKMADSKVDPLDRKYVTMVANLLEELSYCPNLQSIL